VVDTLYEDIAIHEARILGIPIVAMVDTNCDPDLIDYVIPSNDDATRAITLISDIMATAVVEGRGLASEGADNVEAAEDSEEKPEETEEPAEAAEAPKSEEKVPEIAATEQ